MSPWRKLPKRLRAAFRRRGSFGNAPWRYDEPAASPEGDAPSSLVKELMIRVDDLEARLDEVDILRSSVKRLGPQIAKDIEAQVFRATRNDRTAAIDLYTHLAMAFLHLPADDVPQHRVVPVRIYVSEHDDRLVGALEESLWMVLKHHGFEEAFAFPGETGSWRRRLFARTRKAATSDEARVLIDEVRQAAEAPLARSQAETAAVHVEAAAKLVETLGKTDIGAFYMPPFLYMQYVGPDGRRHVISRSLSPREMVQLERHQHLLERPDALLQMLSSVGEDDDSPPQLSPPD
jgi:hypothetical protein